MKELAQSVRKLTRKAYPDAPQHLIAIPDVDMKLRLREARPKDLNAAESLAVRLESYRLAEQQRGSTLRSTEIERKESSDLAFIKDNMVDLKQNISSLSAVVEKLSQSMNQRNNYINRQNEVPWGRNQFRDGNPSNFYNRQYQANQPNRSSDYQASHQQRENYQRNRVGTPEQRQENTVWSSSRGITRHQTNSPRQC